MLQRADDGQRLIKRHRQHCMLADHSEQGRGRLAVRNREAVVHLRK